MGIRTQNLIRSKLKLMVFVPYFRSMIFWASIDVLAWMVSSKNPGKSFRVNLHFHVAISFPPFLAFCGRYFGGNKPSSPVGKGLLLWPFLESERMIASLKTSRGTWKSLTKDWLFFGFPFRETNLLLRDNRCAYLRSRRKEKQERSPIDNG
jgi:hypothetical protein